MKNKFLRHISNPRFLILLILVYIVVIINLSIFRNDLPNVDVDLIHKITPIFLSTVSVVAALLLFDRYGVRKIVVEKQVKTVLELLEDVKTMKGAISGRNKIENTSVGTSFMISKGSQKDFWYTLSEKYIDYPLLMNPKDMIHLSDRYKKYRESPFIPNEIHDLLDFVVWSGTGIIQPTAWTQVYFTQYIANDPHLMQGKYHFRTLREFIDHFQLIITTIESWLNKYTDVPLRY